MTRGLTRYHVRDNEATRAERTGGESEGVEFLGAKFERRRVEDFDDFVNCVSSYGKCHVGPGEFSKCDLEDLMSIVKKYIIKRMKLGIRHLIPKIVSRTRMSQSQCNKRRVFNIFVEI